MQAIRLRTCLTPLLPALLLALHAGTAGALPPRVDKVYEQERAACLDGRSPQDRTTCLQEAGAARAEARRHGLDNGETPAQLRANALLRCQRVHDGDRPACERLALGEGSRSGSVAEGAVLKQITTTSTPTSTPATTPSSTAAMPATAASR